LICVRVLFVAVADDVSAHVTEKLPIPTVVSRVIHPSSNLPVFISAVRIFEISNRIE